MSLFDQPPLHDFPDRAVRELLKNPGNLRELLEDVAPLQAVLLDCNSAVAVDRGFVLEDWRERETDLFFRIPFRQAEPGGAAVVWVLLEHQSAADPNMPLRMLLYSVLRWEQEWKVWEGSHARREPLQLRPIIPLVFRTGLTPWTTNRELGDLIAAPEAFRQFAPHWPPLFFDLAERRTEDLLRGPSNLLQALSVVRAEQADTETFVMIFQEVLQRLEALHDTERVRWQDLLWFVLSWAIRRRPRQDREVLREVIQASQAKSSYRQEVFTMSQAAEQTFDQWVAEQVAKGKIEGKAEGQLLACRETLQRLLTKRFQTLPESLWERIQATTDVERLKAAIDRVFELNSADEVDL